MTVWVRDDKASCRAASVNPRKGVLMTSCDSEPTRVRRDPSVTLPAESTAAVAARLREHDERLRQFVTEQSKAYARYKEGLRVLGGDFSHGIGPTSDPAVTDQHRNRFKALANEFKPWSDPPELAGHFFHPERTPPTLAPEPPPSSELLQFKFAESEFIPVGVREFEGVFDDASWYLYGKVRWNNDEVFGASFGLRATYVLPPDRMPPGKGPLTFISTPSWAVSGSIVGTTGAYHWLLYADNKSCKCSVTTQQTLFQTGLGDWQFGNEVKSLIDLTNVTPIGQSVSQMPTRLTFPTMSFRGPRELALYAVLDVRFNLRLLGDSDLAVLGNPAEHPGPQNPMRLVETTPWKVTAF